MRIVTGSLNSAIPAVILVTAIPVVLLIGKIVFLAVTHKIG